MTENLLAHPSGVKDFLAIWGAETPQNGQCGEGRHCCNRTQLAWSAGWEASRAVASRERGVMPGPLHGGGTDEKPKAALTPLQAG